MTYDPATDKLVVVVGDPAATGTYTFGRDQAGPGPRFRAAVSPHPGRERTGRRTVRRRELRRPDHHRRQARECRQRHGVGDSGAADRHERSHRRRAERDTGRACQRRAPITRSAVPNTGPRWLKSPQLQHQRAGRMDVVADVRRPRAGRDDAGHAAHSVGVRRPRRRRSRRARPSIRALPPPARGVTVAARIAGIVSGRQPHGVQTT